MNKRLQDYLDGLFAAAPKTKYNLEAKEELTSACLDKWNDLRAQGMSEDDAFAAVISGIGDVEGLLNDLQRSAPFDPAAAKEQANKRALFTAAAVALYILGVAIAVLFDELFGMGDLGAIVMLMIAAVATGLLVYLRMSYKPTYVARDSTIVEGVKESLSEGSDKSKKRQAISSALWSLIVLVYLGLSFLTGAWHVTWIIFLVGALLETFISWVDGDEKSKRRAIGGMMWASCSILYFVLSFASGRWDVTWLLFVATIAAQQGVRLFSYWRKGI